MNPILIVTLSIGVISIGACAGAIVASVRLHRYLKSVERESINEVSKDKKQFKHMVGEILEHPESELFEDEPVRYNPDDDNVIDVEFTQT